MSASIPTLKFTPVPTAASAMTNIPGMSITHYHCCQEELETAEGLDYNSPTDNKDTTREITVVYLHNQPLFTKPNSTPMSGSEFSARLHGAMSAAHPSRLMSKLSTKLGHGSAASHPSEVPAPACKAMASITSALLTYNNHGTREARLANGQFLDRWYAGGHAPNTGYRYLQSLVGPISDICVPDNRESQSNDTDETKSMCNPENLKDLFVQSKDDTLVRVTVHGPDGYSIQRGSQPGSYIVSLSTTFLASGDWNRRCRLSQLNSAFGSASTTFCIDEPQGAADLLKSNYQKTLEPLQVDYPGFTVVNASVDEICRVCSKHRSEQ